MTARVLSVPRACSAAAHACARDRASARPIDNGLASASEPSTLLCAVSVPSSRRVRLRWLPVRPSAAGHQCNNLEQSCLDNQLRRPCRDFQHILSILDAHQVARDSGCRETFAWPQQCQLLCIDCKTPRQNSKAHMASALIRCVSVPRPSTLCVPRTYLICHAALGCV